MTAQESGHSIEVKSHKRVVWAYLGYLLFIPLVCSPIYVLDPFVPEGGNGETTMTFTILCAVIGASILIYHYTFSMRSITIGDQIVARYATRTKVMDWDDVAMVVVERRHRRKNGVLIEVYKLNLGGEESALSIDIDPKQVSSILAAVKANSPESCNVVEDVISVRV